MEKNGIDKQGQKKFTKKYTWLNTKIGFLYENCVVLFIWNKYIVWAHHTFKSFIHFTSSKWLHAIVVLIVKHNLQSGLI